MYVIDLKEVSREQANNDVSSFTKDYQPMYVGCMTEMVQESNERLTGA